MGVPDNTVQAVGMTGVRESLVDEISILTKVEARFFDSLKDAPKPKAVKHEFMTDTIRAGADNAAVEGADPTISASTQPTKIYNNCQIQEESYSCSSTANAVTAAGRVTEKDRLKMVHLKGLTRDIEYAFLRGVRVDGSASVAFKMRGALNWTTTNLNKAADADLAADGTVGAGTSRDLSATLVKGVMQNIYTAGGGGKTLTAYNNVFQQSQFDSFAGGTNLRRAIQNGTVDDKVDVYVTAFGTVKSEVHREMPTDVFFICDPTFWKKATLESLGEVKLATSSALNEKWHITVNHTLQSVNEAASGRITNLTTA